MYLFLNSLYKGEIFLLEGSPLSIFNEEKYVKNYPFDLENINNRKKVEEYHLAFLKSGVDIIRTNTFNSNPIRLRNFGVEHFSNIIIQKGVEIAKGFKDKFEIFVAGSVGSLGEDFLRYDLEKIKNVYEYEILRLLEGGIDFFLIETQIFLKEADLIVKTIRNHSNLPIALSFSYPLNGKLLSGENPEEVSKYFSDKVDILGVNCLLNIDDYEFILNDYKKGSNIPLMVYPNGGVPDIISGKLNYPLKPEIFLEYVKKWLKYRVKIVGGCCGISPGHIKEIKWIKN